MARQIYAPRMLTPEQNELVWPIVFEFPGGLPESLFWLQKISRDDVHATGCVRQAEKRKTTPLFTYKGIVASVADKIVSFRTKRGHGFRLEHEPSEGDHHVHLHYDKASDVEFNKGDKTELKFALIGIFDEREDHVCS